MKTSELNLALSFSAPTGTDVRYYLCGIYVTPTYIAASDGHRLCKVESNIELPDDISIIIPYDAVKQLVKIVPKKMRDIVELSIIKDNELYRIGYNETWVIFKPIDGIFPDIHRVIPKNPVHSNEWQSFNWKYLHDAQKAMQDYNGTRHIDFIIIKESILCYYNQDNVEIVIMGLRK